MIEFIDLSKSFGSILALNNVNLKINDGEIFGIAGPNGAGKTTLVRILCTALRPDLGRVTVNGYDVGQNDLEIKRLIGYLPEEPNLYERLTAYRFLDFFAQLYGVLDIKKRIDEVLKTVELSDRAEHRISTFSKGMRHRLSLARAILHDPEILVLDEPTMGLDPSVASKIRELVFSMRRKKTVIVCTHYMDEAEMLCDRMAILKSGSISTIGSPSELKNRVSKELNRKVSLNETFVYFTG